MEPTIYKPSIYKGAGGIYKGAKSIYNGRGVYNDGSSNVFFENIGGKIYPCVKIGNYAFMCENLDYLDSNIVLNPSYGYLTSDNRAWYPYGNEVTYGYNGLKYNLFYDWNSILYLDSLDFNGWKIFGKEQADFFNNFNYEDLKSVDYWPTPGTNESNMNILPCGLLDNTGMSFFNRLSRIATKDEGSSSTFYYCLSIDDNIIDNGDASKNKISMNVRLYKNL